MTITFAADGGDLRVPEVANALLHVLLVDLTDLYQVGMVNLGDMAGLGSDTSNISQVDLDDAMTAPAEGTTIAITDPGTASVQVAIARQALRRSATDLFIGTGAPGMAYDAATLAMDARNSIVLRRTGLVAALFSAVANTVGTTTVDLDVDDIRDAMFQLQTARNSPPFFCTLFPEQLNNFQQSLSGEGGAVQFEAATAGMIQAKGPGYAGNWHGIEFYSSDQVPTANAGADSNGCMWARGAFGYAEAAIAPMLSAAGVIKSAVPGNAVAWIEESRTPDLGTTDFTYNYYTGVVEIEDLRAVGIVTDR